MKRSKRKKVRKPINLTAFKKAWNEACKNQNPSDKPEGSSNENK